MIRFPGRPLHGLVLILGGRGSGKTLLLQAIERRARAWGGHTVVYDRIGHFKPARGATILRNGTPEHAARVAIREAPCTFILDEAALAYPCDAPPREGSALHEIALVGRNPCATGPWRRRGPVALVAATQRPALIATTIRNLLDRLFLFRFPDLAVQDLEWIEKAVRDRELAWKTVPSLPVGSWLVKDCL